MFYSKFLIYNQRYDDVSFVRVDNKYTNGKAEREPEFFLFGL